jgi:uncharacterized LabA/DUF88 family protein
MKKIGFFVDVSNLYYCVAKHFRGKRLDYRHYYQFVADFGEVVIAVAYGAEKEDEATKFKRVLRNIGFETKYKPVKELDKDRLKADWDVGITIDIVLKTPELDTIVLGSADGDLEPLVAWCRSQGKDVIILACGISGDLKKIATEAIEIPESLVEPFKRKKKNEATQTKRT